MTLEELNQSIATGEINEVIRVAETRQVKRLGQIADEICGRDGKRLVLLAGASSAGKTTTAMRLSTQLRVNDRKVLHLSTDDYFVGDDVNPRDENGKLDYEHVECVDIARLAHDINRLMRGEEIVERRYDFARHEGYDSGKTLSLPADGMVVLEGIHALNPRLTEGVDETVKYRMFLEPKPDLDLFAGLCPRPSDARLLRRLVRDNHFRKVSPVTTFGMWPNVLKGEEKWINPFRPFADVEFNSYLSYEMAVLKPYVGGLLTRARLELGDQPIILSLERMLEPVAVVGSDVVPGNSILRETIGGSQLDY